MEKFIAGVLAAGMLLAPAATATAVPVPTAKKYVSVAVSPASGNRLYVDVNPDKGRGFWKIKVQRWNGKKWITKKSYRTKGPKETRTTAKLSNGTYRVVVKPKYRHKRTTSSRVVLPPPVVMPPVVTPPAITTPPVVTPPLVTTPPVVTPPVIAVPEPPTRLRATTNAQADSVYVSWQAPTNAPVEKYIVSDLKGFVWCAVATTSCQFNGIIPGFPYEFVVTAVNSSGASATSKPSPLVAIFQFRGYITSTYWKLPSVENATYWTDVQARPPGGFGPWRSVPYEVEISQSGTHLLVKTIYVDTALGSTEAEADFRLANLASDGSAIFATYFPYACGYGETCVRPATLAWADVLPD